MKKTKAVKRIFALLLTVFMLFSLLIPMVSAVDLVSEVEKDISCMLFDGKSWDPQTFLDGRSTLDIYLIAVDEQSFRYGGGSEEYGFYLYLYNPSEKSIIDDITYSNVQMAVSWDGDKATDYEKFNMKLISKSSNGQYLKFKVIDHYSETDAISMQTRMALMQVNESKRIYEITSFELREKGANKTTDYSFGCKAIFTGYDAGCAPSGTNSSTKTITYKAAKTLSLDVHQCYWRTQTSSKGVGYRNQINAAYFSVPNEVWNKYNELYSIKCEWEEYRTTPMIITDDTTLYDALSRYVGVTIEPHDKNVGYTLGDLRGSYGNSTLIFRYDYAYNIKETRNYWTNTYVFVERPINRLGWVLHSAEEIKLDNECVSAEDILNYYKDYEQDHPWSKVTREEALFSDEVDEGRKAGYQQVTVNLDGTDENGNPMFPLDNYDLTHSRWDKFWDYTLFNGGLSFKSVNTGETYDWFTPIEVFRKGDSLTNKIINAKSDADYEYIMTQHFFANKEMAKEFAEYVKKAIASDETVVLFRYAETDYYSATLSESPAIEGHSLVSWQTVFLNFDVIQLGFRDETQQIKIVPVASGTEDFVSGSVQSPNTTESDSDLVYEQLKDQANELIDNMKENVSGFFEKAVTWLGIFLVVLLVVMLLPAVIRGIQSLFTSDHERYHRRR